MHWETGKRLPLVIGALLLRASPVLAQDGAAGAPVAFPQVMAMPLQSVSGRFSSLNPRNQRDCPYKKMSGRVVSPRLILVDEVDCGRPGHKDLLVNVELSNPADAVRMVTGRHVVITGRFKSAEEDRDSVFVAGFLIAEQAELVAEDPLDRSAADGQAFTSYMMCQPPELDGLAGRIGSELCVQSTVVANLPAAGPALETAARGAVKVSPEDTGPGNPSAISCRLDPGLSDAHLSAIACARNNYWAWWSAKQRNQAGYGALAPP